MRWPYIYYPELLFHSWRHTRCNLIVRLTGTMDLSRYPLVGVNLVSPTSSSMLARPTTRDHMPRTPMIYRHAIRTVYVINVPSPPATTNRILLSHGGSEPVLLAYYQLGSCMRRYIDGKTGRRSDPAHQYVYNQAHNPNLQLWVGKRVIFE